MGESASFRQLVNNVPVLLSEIRQKANTPSPWTPVFPAHLSPLPSQLISAPFGDDGL